MAAMKELFTDLQEQVYSKLTTMGVSHETIFSFEHLLIDNKESGLSFSDFAEKIGLCNDN